MLVLNQHQDYGRSLDPADAAFLDISAPDNVERFLAYRGATQPTPLQTLPALAHRLGLAAIRVKDESTRLDLGSFKALGGAYAVVRLVLEEAGRQLKRTVDFADLNAADVRAVARSMTVGCATDGNHGRSVAAGTQFAGARAAIFVHAGVSARRVEAIATFGAEIIRVPGTYDDAVAEASRVCAAKGWLVVSDTSWPGYERVPGMVMQGYTIMVREAWNAMPQPPTHVFIQAGVGGLAAAIAGHLELLLGERRPKFIVVEPTRAACVLESARAGHAVKIDHDEPTVMAMLECYEPSLIAWRVLSRCADAFMTVDEQDAVEAMRDLARPMPGDPGIVAGESGGAGLAGLCKAMRDETLRGAIGLNSTSRIFLINTEGATDPELYRKLVHQDPPAIAHRMLVSG